MIKEEIVIFGEEDKLIGIYHNGSVPDNNTTAIMLNAGIIHRIGPNQLWVNLARKLTSLNISSLRFDFPGIGDSSFGKSELTQAENYDKYVIKAIDYLNVNKGISNIILIGLCSGADISLKAALQSDKVKGICFINGEYYNVKGYDIFYPTVNKRILRRYYRKNLFSRNRWLKLITGKSNLINNFKINKVMQRITGMIKKRIRLKKGTDNKIENNKKPNPVDISNTIFSSWKNLIDRNVNVYQIYSEGSIGLDFYDIILQKRMKLLNSNNFEVAIIKDADHTFTPIWSQTYLIDLICNWLMKQTREN